MRVRFHPEAEQWYRERSEVAAQAFALEIDHAIQSITEAPLRWPQAEEVSGGSFSTDSRTRFSIACRHKISSLRRLLIIAGVMGTGATESSADSVDVGVGGAAAPLRDVMCARRGFRVARRENCRSRGGFSRRLRGFSFRKPRFTCRVRRVR
jgi:hypothetical protein